MHATSRRALALCLLLPLAAVAARAQNAPAPAATSAIPSAFAALPLRVVGPQAGLGDVLVIGTGARFERTAPDTGTVTIDGTTVADAALAGPWPTGAHAISVQPPASATPPAAPLRFVFDDGAPTMHWEVGDTRLLDRYGLDQNVSRQDPPRRTEPSRDRHVKVLWSPDGRRWLPVLPKGAKTDPTGALADWLIAADKPQVFLWALDDSVFGPGVPVQPKDHQLVRVWGDDQLSAVRDLRLRVLPGDPHDADRAYRLEMVSTDLVGNKTTVSWALARR